VTKRWGGRTQILKHNSRDNSVLHKVKRMITEDELNIRGEFILLYMKSPSGYCWGVTDLQSPDDPEAEVTDLESFLLKYGSKKDEETVKILHARWPTDRMGGEAVVEEAYHLLLVDWWGKLEDGSTFTAKKNWLVADQKARALINLKDFLTTHR